MFEFPETVEDLDTVPEQFRTAYSRAGDTGPFAVSPDIKGMKDSIRTLTNTVRDTRRDKDAALKVGTALKGLGFDDVDSLKARLGELEEAATKKAGAEEQVQRVRDDLNRSHAATLVARDAREKLLTDALKDQLVNRDSLEAIAAEKGKSKLLLPILTQRVQMAEEDGRFFSRVLDENGQQMLDGNGGAISVRSFVAKLKADPEYGDAFEASGNNGTGSQPGGPPRQAGHENPFKKDGPHYNLTKQQELIRSNPALAKQYAIAAGVNPNW